MSVDSMSVENLCGGCHVWGSDPRLERGVCHACERTPEQIVAAHGILYLDPLLKVCVFAYRARGSGASADAIRLAVESQLK